MCGVACGHEWIYAPAMTQPKRRKVRIFTWVILVINVLFLVWIIAAAASTSGHASDCGSLTQQTCDDAKNTGTAIGVFLVVVFWAAVDVILGIIWLVTRRREPVVIYQQAPRQQYAQPAQWQQGPPPGWYADQQNPRLERWWDGSRYTGHVQQARR